MNEKLEDIKKINPNIKTRAVVADFYELSRINDFKKVAD
jgi:hypothetical protein